MLVVAVGVAVEVGVGTKTVCSVVLVVKGIDSLDSITALLLMAAPSKADTLTAIVKPQLPFSAGSTLPRFHRIVFPSNTPLGRVVQLMVARSRSLSMVSRISAPVAVIFPSF